MRGSAKLIFMNCNSEINLHSMIHELTDKGYLSNHLDKDLQQKLTTSKLLQQKLTTENRYHNRKQTNWNLL